MAEKEPEVGWQREHPEPHPDDQPAQIFETMQEHEAWVVRGLLESADIEAVVIAPEAAPDVLPGVGGYVVRVPEEDAEEARRIIAEHRERTGGDETSDESAA
jgi:Putative prokaryotic signal transducing protein